MFGFGSRSTELKMMFNHQSGQIQYYATIQIELPLLCRDLWETMENSSDTNQRHPESSDMAIRQLGLRLAEYFSKKRSNRETAQWPAFNGIITSVEAFQIITRAVTICPRHGVNYKTKTVPVDICAMLMRHIM